MITDPRGVEDILIANEILDALGAVVLVSQDPKGVDDLISGKEILYTLGICDTKPYPVLHPAVRGKD
jgi:hypothetical protein